MIYLNKKPRKYFKAKILTKVKAEGEKNGKEEGGRECVKFISWKFLLPETNKRFS